MQTRLSERWACRRESGRVRPRRSGCYRCLRGGAAQGVPDNNNEGNPNDPRNDGKEPVPHVSTPCNRVHSQALAAPARAPNHRTHVRWPKAESMTAVNGRDLCAATTSTRPHSVLFRHVALSVVNTLHGRAASARELPRTNAEYFGVSYRSRQPPAKAIWQLRWLLLSRPTAAGLADNETTHSPPNRAACCLAERERAEVIEKNQTDPTQRHQPANPTPSAECIHVHAPVRELLPLAWAPPRRRDPPKSKM